MDRKSNLGSINFQAVVIRIHPLYLMMPAAITASYAFHLPVGTPPNALVAGYANIRTKEMVTYLSSFIFQQGAEDTKYFMKNENLSK